MKPTLIGREYLAHAEAAAQVDVELRASHRVVEHARALHEREREEPIGEAVLGARAGLHPARELVASVRLSV